METPGTPPALSAGYLPVSKDTYTAVTVYDDRCASGPAPAVQVRALRSERDDAAVEQGQLRTALERRSGIAVPPSCERRAAWEGSLPACASLRPPRPAEGAPVQLRAVAMV